MRAHYTSYTLIFHVYDEYRETTHISIFNDYTPEELCNISWNINYLQVINIFFTNSGKDLLDFVNLENFNS